MFRPILAALAAGFAVVAHADPLWLDTSQPRSAYLYAGITTPSGRQLLSGYFYGLYRRDTIAAPWVFGGGLSDTWSLARDAGGRTYAAGPGGRIAYSDNDGTSWQFNFLPCTPNCYAVIVATTPTGALVAADSDDGAYRSTDRGVTWMPATGDLPTLFAPPDIAARTDGTLFAVGDSYLVTSTNDGATWSPIVGMNGWLTVEPLPANELLLGRYDGLWRRNAGGAYTQIAAGQITSRVTNLYRAPDGRWLASTAAGIWRGDATLATWTLVGPGVVGIRAFVPQPGAGALAVGMQGAARSDAQFQNWQEDMTGIADAAVWNIAASGSRLFVATVGGEVFRSDDGAATWQRSHTGLPACEIALARLDNARLFAMCIRSSNATYTSIDNGATWTLQSASPTLTEIVSASATIAIARDRNAGLWRSTDGGATWAPSPQAFDGQFPSNLVRGGDGVLWVRTNAGPYRSADLGVTWHVASAGLPTPTSPNLWPVANGVLSFGNGQAYRYDAGADAWTAFGDAYAGTPSYAVMSGGRVVIGTNTALLVGDVATGHWRRVERGSGINRLATLADGRTFGLSTYSVNSVQHLSNDRLFADTFERP